MSKREDVIVYLHLVLSPHYYDQATLNRAVDDAMDLIDGYVERELALDNLYRAEELAERARRFVADTREERQERHRVSLRQALERART